MIVLRPYNTAGSVTFTLRQAGSDAFATSSHWTPAAGDVKLSLDGGTQANATNLPTFANGQWTLALAGTELQAARVRVNIDDGDIIPESILIETYGHASAAYPTAYADQWLGIASKITTDHGAGSYVDSGAGLDASGVRTAVGLASANLDTQLAAIPTVAPLDATATEAAALAALVSHGVLVTGGDVNLVSVAGVTVGGVADFKADVSGLLTAAAFAAALPTNFGVLSIDTSGNVTTTGGGALTPTQATWLEETHAKAMLIGDYPQILVDRDPAIGERFKLHKGADYKADLNNALRIVDVGGTVFPAAATEVKIEIGHRVNANEHATIEGVIEADDSDLVAVFDVLAADTAGITPGPCDYMLYELVSDQWRRLDVTGQCHIDRGIRGA